MKKIFFMLLCLTLLLNTAVCFAEGGAFSYRFADAKEAAELLLSNRGYYDNLTQNDLNYRMQSSKPRLKSWKPSLFSKHWTGQMKKRLP